ncbi:MAG: hypothetical protein GTN89_06075 [Acidobacteria bacterium]|nr:hypothetical protein [Acidobacteriota bacterium]NIM61617.1 hypothetical protein [Acidobacteriota bacterium]NIO58881.1 hypothetical protein [Acidobacteriota bacterium]NIQ29932.1 hypothetical protein [Acidobacteriota bacterium]NIQ87425.1 hypothetical protein [Acidobacteriota bacterium]
MKNILIALVPVALIAALWFSPAIGQESTGAAPEEVVRELAGIQQALEELVDLLVTMRRNQDAELILRRIEMQERRLAPLDGRLDRNSREQQDAKSSIGNIKQWMSQTEERIDEIEREGREEVPLQLYQELRMAQQQLAQEEARLERLQQRQIDLENTLADRRDDVEILEDLLRDLID